MNYPLPKIYDKKPYKCLFCIRLFFVYLPPTGFEPVPTGLAG
jgi:hypothetical protein